MAAEVRKGQLTADFGKAAVDYGKHRAGFPVELFDRLAAMGDAGAARVAERHDVEKEAAKLAELF